MKRIGLSLVALASLASFASAHFIWGEIQPSGGRRFTLTFAEVPGDSVLPIMGRLAPKVEILGAKTGPMATEGNSLAYPLANPTSAVLAYIPYGPFDRDGGLYGLDYYAKAVGVPSDAARPVGKGFEIVATPRANVWVVSALVDGKPAKDAQIVFGSDHDHETKSTVGGTLEIPITGAAIAVRATREIERGGTYQGKTFRTTKVWTSLVLPALPVVTEGSDPDAYRALERAEEDRESVRMGSSPFAVDFTATNGQDKLNGTTTWDGVSPVKTTFPTEGGATKHVRGQLASLFMHRLAAGFAAGDGKSKITWTDDTNEFGRKVIVADRFDSSYRIKDGQIRQVVRTFGKNVLTLDILETKSTGDGKYLTTKFRSIERDKATGELHNELIYNDEFRLELGEWLPAKRHIEGKVDGNPILMEAAFGAYRKAPAASVDAKPASG